MCECLGGVKPGTRNESEVAALAAARGGRPVTGLHHRPILIIWIDLSVSTPVGTRKKANYACIG